MQSFKDRTNGISITSNAFRWFFCLKECVMRSASGYAVICKANGVEAVDFILADV